MHWRPLFRKKKGTWRIFFFMRKYYEKPESYTCIHGSVYKCNHPLYDTCTLYFKNGIGLAVIQQRFNSRLKVTFWSAIDRWLIDDIYNQEGFDDYFNKEAGQAKNELYPTVTVRQIMYVLKMKPLPKYFWETRF